MVVRTCLSTFVRAVALFALAFLPLAASAHAGSPVGRASVGADYAPGEVIVKFKEGLAADDRADALRDRGASVKRRLPGGRTVLARLAAGEDVPAAVRRFMRDPRVAWAEPNARRVGGSVPNDPFLAEQWSLRNTGQTVDGTAGAAGADIRAPEAWDRTTGSPDVKVAVIDSGIDFSQPDLQPNLWRNPGESGGGREFNGVDDDGDGFVDDVSGWDFVQQDNDPSDNYGHGTHVSGTIAARGDNALGISGVAWRASIIPVRVLDNINSGWCSDTAAGMAYAVRAGARIVNMSLGQRLPCQAERDVIDGAPNTLFVIAAMNSGLDLDAQDHPYYPCAYPSPNIVCVAASDSSDRLADFSDYGARSVDLAAPGVSILSSYLKWGSKQSLFTDGFETAPLSDNWTTGGTPNAWGRDFVYRHSGSWSVSDSNQGQYANNTDNWLRLSRPIDLTGRRDCAASVWLRSTLPEFDPSQPVEAQDRLVAETSLDGVDWGRRPSIIIGGTGGGFSRWLVDLSTLEGRSGGSLRFHLLTNDSVTSEGVSLDDFEILCVPVAPGGTGGRDEFEFDWGTSMATPHVAGVAALLAGMGCTEPQTVALLTGTARTPVTGARGQFTPSYGYGIVDAKAATDQAKTDCTASAGGSTGGTTTKGHKGHKRAKA